MTKDYFKCGVPGCGHTQRARFDDFWAFKVDTQHMYDHYKWEHAETVGTYFPNKGMYANQDYWVFKPIPAEVAPVYRTEDGDSYSWDEVMKYTEDRL